MKNKVLSVAGVDWPRRIPPHQQLINFPGFLSVDTCARDVCNAKYVPSAMGKQGELDAEQRLSL